MSRMEELLSSEESGKRSGTTRRKLAIAGAVVLLLVLALVLPPLINLGKYRRSITASMSDALGRPVTVGDMQLRLLPMPGIVMSDFTVAEDPAFGYEPALHANSVVASLRLTSLWRGRLEVSRISLDEANLNLVRDSAWTVEYRDIATAGFADSECADRQPPCWSATAVSLYRGERCTD